MIVLCSGCLADSDAEVQNNGVGVSEIIANTSDEVTGKAAWDYTIFCSVEDVAGRGKNASVQAVGEIIKYNVKITNTGKNNLTAVSIYDSWGDKKTVSTLAPGEVLVHTGYYTVQEDEMLSYNEKTGVLINAVRVTVNETESKRFELRVPVEYILQFYGSEEQVAEGEITKSTMWIGSNTISVGGDGHTIQLTHNPNAKDPTYAELIAFLCADRTDMKKYVVDKYVCADFAEDLQSNAEYEGWNSAYVTVTFTDGSKHACNAFNTVDRGLIFVDCTGTEDGEGPTVKDCLVKIEQGQEYKPEYAVKTDWETETMGVVRSYGVHWG